ncbi:hypothetical protein KKF05_05255 [Patescibacteria group bacterium]|nr:hypothetical protein [Patescibacteria group bacterium]MBU1029133.1 hypothetical protein [Patescibacteria group bacterium]
MNITTTKKLASGLIFLLLGIGIVVLAGLTIQQSFLESRLFAVGVRFQEFPDLAKNFWRGETSIPLGLQPTRYYSDAFPLAGRLYLPFGPLPAVIFMPLVWLAGDIFPTLTVTFLLIVLAGGLMFGLAQQQGLKKKDALWIAGAYALGSALTPLAIPLFTSWSVQLLASVFLLAALYAHFSRHSSWLTGGLLALATITRPLSVLGIVLFVLWNDRKLIKKRPRRVIELLLPLILAGLIIGGYNFARFNNPLETGYHLQWEYNPALVERMVHGANDLRYLPTNLWYFLAAPPKIIDHFPFVVPDAMGMGLLFSCPYLIYLFVSQNKRRLLAPLGAAAIGLLPALTYYASGYSQIGYRYAVDVYPLIFLAWIMALHGRLPHWVKALIFLAVITNITWMTVYFT